jgi:cytochrome P450
MHVLAEHQDIQEKVRKEIDEKLKGKPPTYQDLQKLEYLGWVIKEVLRMYPPVTFVPSRRATKNVVLGDYKIPKGVSIDKKLLISKV